MTLTLLMYNHYIFILISFDLNVLFFILGLHQGICKPFLVAGHQVGLVRPDVLKHLQRFPEVRLVLYSLFINLVCTYMHIA